MKLYLFEHCSLCFRVRMIAALKGLHLQEQVVLDDDTPTMEALVGKRVIPILVKDDGTPMLESMNMVDHIDAIGEPILVGEERRDVSDLEKALINVTPPLTMPRYPLLGLPEFATIAARDHYLVRKRQAYGDFAELRAETRNHIARAMPHFEALDGLIERPEAINGTLSRDDIRILPLLRSVAVVEGLKFPPRVRDYFETMMEKTGYPPLPKI